MKSKRRAQLQLRTYENQQPAPAPIAEPAVTLPVASDLIITEPELQSRIRDLAYRLYLQRGRIHGHDLEDWLEAEGIVRYGGKLAA